MPIIRMDLSELDELRQWNAKCIPLPHVLPEARLAGRRDRRGRLKELNGADHSATLIGLRGQLASDQLARMFSGHVAEPAAVLAQEFNTFREIAQQISCSAQL